MPDKKIGVGLMTNASGPAARVIDFLNLYIYDRLLETPNVEAVYAERLAKLKSDMAAAKAGYLVELEKRSRRPWTLIPGSGEVFRFQIGSDGTAETLRYDDAVFRRVPQ
ncbi:MAG: hypothetical protein M3041_02610 [Acidobacteriota bacterium]|nr:hypothetical protein [Acidobacteriota bacterium]